MRALPSGKDVLVGKLYRIHFNLHHHLFSIVAIGGEQDRRVVAAVSDATMTEVRFHVSTSGWRRTHETGVRSVHAWCVGRIEAVDTNPTLHELRRVTYNPRERGPEFQLADTDDRIDYAPRAVFAKPSQQAEHGYAWVAWQDAESTLF